MQAPADDVIIDLTSASESENEPPSPDTPQAPSSPAHVQPSQANGTPGPRNGVRIAQFRGPCSFPAASSGRLGSLYHPRRSIQGVAAPVTGQPAGNAQPQYQRRQGPAPLSGTMPCPWASSKGVSGIPAGPGPSSMQNEARPPATAWASGLLPMRWTQSAEDGPRRARPGLAGSPTRVGKAASPSRKRHAGASSTPILKKTSLPGAANGHMQGSAAKQQGLAEGAQAAGPSDTQPAELSNGHQASRSGAPSGVLLGHGSKRQAGKPGSGSKPQQNDRVEKGTRMTKQGSRAQVRSTEGAGMGGSSPTGKGSDSSLPGDSSTGSHLHAAAAEQAPPAASAPFAERAAEMQSKSPLGKLLNSKHATPDSASQVKHTHTTPPPPGPGRGTVRFGSTAKVLAMCKLMYYRISECGAAGAFFPSSPPYVSQAQIAYSVLQDDF